MIHNHSSDKSDGFANLATAILLQYVRDKGVPDMPYWWFEELCYLSGITPERFTERMKEMLHYEFGAD